MPANSVFEDRFPVREAVAPRETWGKIQAALTAFEEGQRTSILDTDFTYATLDVVLRGKANALNQLVKARISSQRIEAGIDLEICEALVTTLK